ncbi:type II toxin-antitoxin system HicA family toxin [Candidatus Peregrinibacteria bacterium]|nr:type II toxin-antitoxin system HicA family toxin [Candidatus Peregrinibacteria bacterium]
MVRLPVLTGYALLKVLQRHGFLLLRQKGSHVFVESANGKCGTTIPIYRGEELGKGLLKSILNDLDLDTEDLDIMLHS